MFHSHISCVIFSDVIGSFLNTWKIFRFTVLNFFFNFLLLVIGDFNFIQLVACCYLIVVFLFPLFSLLFSFSGNLNFGWLPRK